MLNQLKSTIYNYLAVLVNDFNTEIGGRLYYVQYDGKDDPLYPYAVYQFVSGSSDRDTGTRFEKPIMQLTIYDDESSSVKLNSIGKKADARFDGCENSLSMTEYYVLSVDRVSPERETKTFSDHWQWSADYEIWLQKK